MPKCPKCGKEVGNSIFCVKCGNLIKEACPSCGTWVDVSMKTCPKCGKPNRLYQ